MNREDIIRMAREAGIKNDCDGIWCTADQLERFFQAAYAAGVAAERHECAKIVDGNADGCNGMTEQILRSNAAAIRARGNT